MIEEYAELEKSVKERKRPARLIGVVVAMFVFGLGLVFVGSSLVNNSISADTDNTNTPPVPPGPASSVTPPMPGTADQNGPDFSFPAGWSMVSGQAIGAYDITPFKDNGLVLFSFNDPAYPVRAWSTFPTEGTTDVAKAIKPAAPLGYYIYNSGTDIKKITLKTASADNSQILYARGWHILYWPGEASTKDELLSKINLTYADGAKMTAVAATSSDNHKASVKMFVVVNENTIALDKSVKELTGADSETSISKIPAESYFWFYLRRTKERVVSIDISGSSAQDEKTKIDAWLKANNLNDCGDSKNTEYTGGSCLFDESTGKTKDKYEYLIEKFPNKPWG